MYGSQTINSCHASRLSLSLSVLTAEVYSGYGAVMLLMSVCRML